jgi:hypothetical protein
MATTYSTAAAADLVFTLTNEAGIILTDISQNVQSVVTEVRDAENEVVAVAQSGMTNEISINGYANGSIAATVGAILTLSNDTDLGGMSGGTIIVKSVSFSHGQGEFQKVSISATKYGSTMTLSA